MDAANNILVIGSGGREHALCWKLSQSPYVNNVYCLPGSFGISKCQKVSLVTDLDINDYQSIGNWCKAKSVCLAVIGPEDPLVRGISDVLTGMGIHCFGPKKSAAIIEADKSWSKSFMIRHNIPTAKYEAFTDADAAKAFVMNATYPALVVKAAGLATGKGVVVAESKIEACQAIDEMLIRKKFGEASSTIVIEELLEGEEISVLAFTDGESVSVMLPSQDHKRIGDGDIGPNTGGMGAYCPCPLISDEQLRYVTENVLQRAIDGLKSEGIEYIGCLYAGMMLTSEGPKTLEFNCRFGDPETQVTLPLLQSDLFLIMMSCCTKSLSKQEVIWKTGVTNVGVVMASKGYPESSTKGSAISGVKIVSGLADHLIFHSGTARSSNGALVTAGGRVLLVSVCAPSIRTAASLATSACKQITFPGAQFRKDIAHKAFLKCGGLSYLDSGVDIEAGAALVKAIEPAARSSHRSGVLGRLGCYGGLYEVAKERYVNANGQKVKFEDPVLVEGTDGVGTKLKIASELNKYDTIGIDLVAMCVNDILCAGAEPLAFLDYIACGKLDVDVAAIIVEGIARACKLSGCALLGGETAEMPAMYDIGKYDLAGFAVGIVENKLQLPKINDIISGDVILGLSSTGIHSNGFSLVNRIFKEADRKYDELAPFSVTGKTFGEELLTPTGLYVKPLLNAIRSGRIKALAHITGGGLLENIPRVLPAGVRARLNALTFKINPVFGWLAAMGGISEFEMLRTYNCGVGMVVIVAAEDVDKIMSLIEYHDVNIIGEIETIENAGHRVIIENYKAAMEPLIAPYIKTISCTVLNSKGLSYKDSGVDIEAGDSLVNLIKPLAKTTTRDGVIGGLGGFGGLFRLNEINKRYKEPILVMGTDGVGTKLKIAQDISKHDTVGIDLVAMCVNDILCNGAEPLTFLDYFACGILDVNVAHDVLVGITKGCKKANCALLGGETAEMPGMYSPGTYDVAGFALGVVEKSQILPKLKEINVGDSIIGLPSNGVHSNGFSLIHKLMSMNSFKMSDRAPFSEYGLTFAEELLKPAKIYVKSVLPAIHSGKVKAIAHITGGGLIDNIPRIIPENMRARLNAQYWHVHPVFAWIADTGNVEDAEMIRTFNCGLGMIVIVSHENQAEVMNIMRNYGAMVVGSIQARSSDGARVVVDNFSMALEFVRRLPILPRKKVAVLISGNGSNLQALIDSTRDSSQGICADVTLVISNKGKAYGVERAKKEGIPCRIVLKSKYDNMSEFENAIHQCLESAKIDIVCLAGFMRILSPEFVRKWHGRLLNIHPSLLPKHPGMNAQQQALDALDKETGCTVHFVDEGVDTGAILVQERVAVRPNDTLETLSERIHQAEHRAYPKALRLLATGRVRLSPNNKLIHLY